MSTAVPVGSIAQDLQPILAIKRQFGRYRTCTHGKDRQLQLRHAPVLRQDHSGRKSGTPQFPQPALNHWTRTKVLIFNKALRAHQILTEKYQIHADVWRVTSYNELRRNALEAERWNRLHPAEAQKHQSSPPRTS